MNKSNILQSPLKFNLKHYQNGNQTAKDNGSGFDIRIQPTEEVQPSSDHNSEL